MAAGALDLRRSTGLAGLLAALLFAAGNALWAFDQPAAGASAARIVAFYTHASSRILIGGSLSLISIAFLAAFAAGVRSLVREQTGAPLLADTAFAGALLLLAAGLGAETINMAAAARAGDGSLTPELGRALFEISFVLGYNAAGAGIGILLGAVAVASLRSGGLISPAAAIATLALALAFLTPLSRFLVAPSVVLLAIAAVRLRWARPRAVSKAG